MRTDRMRLTDHGAPDGTGEVSLEEPSPGVTGRRNHPVTRIAWPTLGLFLMAMSQPPSAENRDLLDLPLLRGCAWPFISDVQTLNAFYPDTNATYWVAPYVALPGSQLIVQGTYPNSRFMSLDTYDRLGQSVGAIYDAAIEPDAGDTNPFVDPAAGPGGRFTVTISPPQDPPQTSPSNTIPGPPLGLPTMSWRRKATSSTACTSPLTLRSPTAGSRSRALRWYSTVRPFRPSSPAGRRMTPRRCSPSSCSNSTPSD